MPQSHCAESTAEWGRMYIFWNSCPFFLVTRMRRTLFQLIVIVIVIARMAKNDQEWSLEQTRIVNSSSFRSRFSTVGLWHNDQIVFNNDNNALLKYYRIE